MTELPTEERARARVTILRGVMQAAEIWNAEAGRVLTEATAAFHRAVEAHGAAVYAMQTPATGAPSRAKPRRGAKAGGK